MPRYTSGVTSLFGGQAFAFVDGVSLIPLYEEIFQNEVYRFEASNSKPFIIDGGANVGVSVLYFKRLFPDSEIIAFEPDGKVFDVLERNVRQFSLDKVTLVNKALWSSETTLNFFAEGADSGRVVETQEANVKVHQVPTVRLRDFLDRPVDFLKLDIEGAETEVICDCADRLGNVHRIFVEYHSFEKAPQTLTRLLATLEASGFRVHIQQSVTSNRPFIEPVSHNGMDMAINIFASRADGKTL